MQYEDMRPYIPKKLSPKAKAFLVCSAKPGQNTARQILGCKARHALGGKIGQKNTTKVAGLIAIFSPKARRCKQFLTRLGSDLIIEKTPRCGRIGD